MSEYIEKSHNVSVLISPLPPDTQKALSPVTLWHTRGGHHHGNEPPKGVHEDGALAPFDQLGAIASVVTAATGCFDGLCVNNRRAGLAVTAFEDTEVAPQHIVESFPGAITTPLPEGVIDNPSGRQIMGDQAPRTTTTQDVEHGIDDFTFRVFLWSTAGFRG